MAVSFRLPWQRQGAPPIDASRLNVELPRADLKQTATDAKRALGDGADQIASVAADISREAAKLGRDVGREAGKAGREAAKLGREAAKRAGAIAIGGEVALRTIGSDTKATLDDLRSYRMVKKAGPDLRPGLALFAGISAGLAAMFFLDPEQGRRRRALLLDQLRKWARLSGTWVDGTTRDLRNRSIGLAHEARKAVGGASEQLAGASERATETRVAGATPDAATDLAATDQAATAEYPEPTFAGERPH